MYYLLKPAFPDACRLEYRALRHNAWIRAPDDGAPIVGYPRPNHQNDVPSPTSRRDIIHPDPRVPTPDLFHRHATSLIFFWRALWLASLLAACAWQFGLFPRSADGRAQP